MKVLPIRFSNLDKKQTTFAETLYFMKQLLAILSFGLLSLCATAQQKISIEKAVEHEGDSVIICSKVYGGKFFSNRQPTITLLNVGAAYPNSLLTIVIKEENRAAFSNKPEEFYVNKEICVTGTIRIFKGKPEIEITSEKAITINN